MARMRFAWTPWPSWTSEYWLSRIHGMSRETASSRIAWVDGPNAVRSARRMKVSSSASQSNSGSGLDEVVDQAYGEPRGREADLLVDVPEDHVVAARLALDRPGLAAPDVVADDLLQGERGVLGDVAEPGALVSRSTKPPRRPREQECSRRPGSISSRLSVKPGIVLVGNSSSEPRSTTRWIAFS